MHRLLFAALCVAPFLAAEEPADPRRLDPEHAPTPYSAAEIRQGCPAGRSSVYLLERKGAPPVEQVVRFIECDQDFAVLEASNRTPNGKPLGKPRRSRGTWKQFQSHGSFPQASTTVEEATADVPAGEFACWLYTVRQDAKKTISRFHFAKTIPGPPVLLTMETDGEITFTMKLVEFRPFDYKAHFGDQARPAADQTAPAGEVEAKILTGKELLLLISYRTATTLDAEGNPTPTQQHKIDHDRPYLYLHVKSPTKIASARLRVTDGRLRGAILHAKSKEPLANLLAYYPLPPHEPAGPVQATLIP